MATAVTVDKASNAYVVGAAGPNFPVTASAFQPSYGLGGDAFISKLEPPSLDVPAGTLATAGALALLLLGVSVWAHGHRPRAQKRSDTQVT